MPISALPEAPSTNDPANFATEADAFVAALATFRTEANALAVAADADATSAAADAASAAADRVLAAAAALTASSATAYFGTSSASLSIGSGAKSVTGVTGKSFADGDDVYLVSRSNPANRMHGPVTSANMGAGTMTVTVASDGFAGSGGPYTDWMVISGPLMALLAGTGTDLRVGTSAIAALTADAIYDALAEVTLTDAATIAVDMASFINGAVTLGGNRTLGNPSNTKPGQTGRIRVIQDGTGSRTLAFASNWKRAGGAPTLTTTAGAIDIIEYDVVTSSYILYDLIRNPT